MLSSSCREHTCFRRVLSGITNHLELKTLYSFKMLFIDLLFRYSLEGGVNKWLLKEVVERRRVNHCVVFYKNTKLDLYRNSILSDNAIIC